MNQFLAVIVKCTDGANTHAIGYVHRFAPGLGVNFTVSALCFGLVISGTIATIHLMLGSLVYLVQLQTPILSFKDGSFALQTGDERKTAILAQPKPKPPDKIAFRKDDVFVVWDSRGLSIRKGKKLITTRLPEIAVTPKLFSRDEILETKALVAQKRRFKDASALASSRRVGDFVYLLPRWLDSDGRPWLEALARIDLKGENPKPQLLGRLGGLAASDMMIVKGRLSFIDRYPNGDWGLSSFDPESGEILSEMLGAHLVRFAPLSSALIMVIERTNHGTAAISRVDLSSLARRLLYEGKGNADWVDSSNPNIIRFNTPGSSRVYNIETGATLQCEKGLEARLVLGGLLLWSGGPKPAGATLYELSRFELIAQWLATTE